MEQYSGFHHACSELSAAPLRSARSKSRVTMEARLRTASENQFHLFFNLKKDPGHCGYQESLCKNNLSFVRGMLYLFILRSHMLSLLPTGVLKNRERRINTCLSADIEPEARRIPYRSACKITY